MRVALHIDDVHVTSGGAATFQRSVLDALAARIARVGTGPHSYVVVREAPGASGAHAATLDGFETVVAPWSPVREVLDRATSTLTVALGRRAPKIVSALRSPFDRVLDRVRADVVWFVGASYRTTDRPHVLTVWDVQHRVQPWFPEVSAHGEWERRERFYSRAVAKAFAVVVANDAAAAEVARAYGVGDERLVRIPHPAPARARHAAPREALTKVGVRGEFVLYPAQMWAHKNHVVLFEALALLKGAGRAMQLVLTGSDKGNRAFLEQRARELGVEGSVVFAGFVDDDMLAGLYNHAHALVFPSYFGPENLPPLEAFAWGLPVIAADRPGIGEQLGDGAILLPPGDAHAWSAAILSLDDTALRATLIARGRERLVSRSPARYVDGVMARIDAFASVRGCWAPSR